jgi:alpha-ketoglutarate-dependent taurine dioxygenase
MGENRMKYHLHENGWTVIVDEDLRTLSDEDIRECGRLTVENMAVVFKNQTLTPEDEMHFCSTIGRVPTILSERSKHIALNETILRVTGQKNEYGEEGLFGHRAALDWHANQTSNKNRMPLIWLYGAAGTVGSRTSWINNILSYEDLDQETKDEIQDIEIFCGYKNGSYSNSSYFKEHINYDNPIKLVQVNKAGKTGLFFPFLQIFGFKDRSEDDFNRIMTKLREHVLLEKYAYHHDWQDGDVVLSEQWLSIHKRWEFENMEERVLHRIAFHYDKIY